MAGAGDWSIVGVIDERARDLAVGMLVDWALPIEKRHDGSLPLAAAEDPEETD